MVHSAREHAAALRRSRVFALSLLSLATIAVAGSTLPAGSSPLGAAAGTSQVRIILSGYGDVTVAGADAPYTCTNNPDSAGSAGFHVDAGSGCPLSVPTGTKLTFRATPKPVLAPEPGFDARPDPPVASEFQGWSRPECTSDGSCTVKTAADDELIVAQFSPVWLEALVDGSGTVDAGGVRRTCTDRCIMGLFKAGTRVTVTGQPTTPGAAPRWGFGCDPYESDLSSGRCVVNMSNIRNFVAVSFDGSDPQHFPPFNQAVPLKVELAGDGQGQVQGSGKSADLDAAPWSIDCGIACDLAGLQYQTQVRLRAVEGADSVFERWAGPPCLSEETCTFTVGKYPKVTAVFRKNAQPLSAAVLTVRATGTRGTRAVVARLETNGATRTTLRLLRKGRTLGRKSFDVAAGTRRLTLPVPKSVKPGWCALSIEVVGTDGTTRTFRKWLRLRT